MSTSQMGHVARPSPTSVTVLTVPTNARPSERAWFRTTQRRDGSAGRCTLVRTGVDEITRRSR